jgi:hypothetical protein
MEKRGIGYVSLSTGEQEKEQLFFIEQVLHFPSLLLLTNRNRTIAAYPKTRVPNSRFRIIVLPSLNQH